MTKIHVSKRLLGSKLLLLFKISCGAYFCIVQGCVVCKMYILMVEGTKAFYLDYNIYEKVVDGKRKRRERKKEKREKVKKKFL